MTFRQKLLQIVYPLLMKAGKMRAKAATLTNRQSAPPGQPFHQLQAELNGGQLLDFETLRGKKVLLVNTASNCGYTGQYAELQALQNQWAGQLVVLGFPANDFKEQEQGSDADIARFCQTQFGLNFPLAKKSVVRKTANQHPVYQWLTDPARNGWNSKAPEWNFSKYLISEAGALSHYFPPGISPMDQAVQDAIRSKAE